MITLGIASPAASIRQDLKVAAIRKTRAERIRCNFMQYMRQLPFNLLGLFPPTHYLTCKLPTDLLRRVNAEARLRSTSAMGAFSR